MITLNKSTSRFCLLDEKEIVAGGIVDIKNYPDQREYKDNLKENIIPENYAVSEIDRSIKCNHRPGLCGLRVYRFRKKHYCKEC